MSTAARGGPRCSVIIPVFNGEAHVARSVASALSQTFTDREVVVVNDGSTDGTAAALAPHLSDIAYIERPHRGVSAARNAGVAASSGELVAFLDADDIWPRTWLETAVAHLDSHPHTDFLTHPVRTRPFRLRRFRSSRQAYWITQYNFISYMVVMPRALFDAVGGFDEELHACVDWDLWIRVLRIGARVSHFPAPSFWYTRRSSSITADHRRNMHNECRMFERLGERFGTSAFAARLSLARGKAALAEDAFVVARREFFAASISTSPLAWWSRLLALASAAAPHVARRTQTAIVSRRRERQRRWRRAAVHRFPGASLDES